MKKSYIVLTTIAIETVVLWGVSLFFEWGFIDTIFLGGIAIFGCVWLSQLYFNQNNNQFNGYTKGWTGQNSGGIKQFHFKMSPITLGLLIFAGISFFITIIMYYPYFLS
ncbi:hypothetical protein [Bacillus sp. FJAT-22090]|uniref:hypothetical protein n=1 Tax=Bacillus sp. FJAT-22090 TaxID=1581038 RepID=UPI0011A8E7DD|nr:hypothetical protein [Bacillus sp. FJAT-22090]